MKITLTRFSIAKEVIRAGASMKFVVSIISSNPVVARKAVDAILARIAF